MASTSYIIPNKWRAVTPTARGEMGLLSDAAVVRAFEETWRTVDGKPNEPDLVLGFFAYGLDDIEEGWNELLQRFHLRTELSAIFTHQTPKVEPLCKPAAAVKAAERFGEPSTKTCELGDLLVIVTHAENPVGSGNAVLLQAKGGFPGRADPLQRILYEHAARFEYRRSAPRFNGLQRTLRPKNDLSLAYWDLITSPGPWPVRSFSPKPTAVLWAADARKDRILRNRFGEVLVELIFGRTGKPFGPPTSDDLGWSRIIRDLVDVTAGKSLKKSPANLRNYRGRLGPLLAAADHSKGPLLVRNSLSDVLRFLDESFNEYSEKIMHAIRPFGDAAFDEYREYAMRADEGDGVPPIKRNDGEDPDGDGLSILFIHCSSIG